MAETILFSLAEEVFKKLGSAALTEIASAWGFKTQLNKLKTTTNTLKNVLLDAEERQSGSDAADSHAVGGWLESLSMVVYAADDIFDEFNAVAARKQLKGGHRLTKEVRTFFSHSNQVALAFKISRKIKKIREELVAIEENGKLFNFVPRPLERGSAMSRRRDQTTSFVDEDGVIGRNDEKEALLKMLLESSSSGHENGHDEGITVIPIVGMGGMGKTTLAQLVYNDSQVKDNFDLRLWVCVSNVFNIEIIIDKLLKSATNNETPKLEMDQLESRWREAVANKKYLLVLDDVWNESRVEWLKLSEKLKIGKGGSKIIVTTRSLKVATAMGITHPYQLKELTEEESWKLFEKMAFNTPEEAQQKPHLVKIGEEIVKKCGRVPLAIRTLGCLLYGKEKEEWLSIKDKSPARILDDQNNIINILKFSYHHLCSPLKKCFAYCALFPKDYEFDKEILKDLWIAEGFIVVVDEGQSLDKVAEDYFHNLVQRGFFQDIEMNEWEEIKSCKMHDLMHDLAQEVAGVKYKVAELVERDFDERDFDDKIFHLSIPCKSTSSWEIPNCMLNMKLLRTFLTLKKIQRVPPDSEFNSQELVTRFRCLRVLDLQNMGLKSLPSSIGKLIHLRYLNLSYSAIEKLSDSITDLWNLQTLKLRDCYRFETLPANMRKLINLRSLDVGGCGRLSHMPSGLGGLTLLNSLPHFRVKREHDAANSRYKPTPTAKLSDLKNLNKLRGTLHIEIKGNLENSMVEAGEAELSNKHQLSELCISFPYVDDVSPADCKHDETVLQGLQPPSKIKSLRIDNYRGEKVSSWARMDNLVKIKLWKWSRCQQLPAFSQLPSLKRLELFEMGSVEYIESDDVCGVYSSKIFFPSLEELELTGMKNLKGWWKEEDASGNENESSESERASNELAAQRFPTRFKQFSKLSKLSVSNCPNLRLLPVCPNVEDLSLWRTNKTLSVLKIVTTSTCTSEPSSSSTGSGLKLKKLQIDGDNKLESTERLGDVFTTLSSSLRSLTFLYCNMLRIGKGLEHLTALEELRIQDCYELDEGMPWKAFNTTLRSLSLSNLWRLVGLPRGLQHLSNLRSLSLEFNWTLEELPEWMNCLSSLEYLLLYDCPRLRCLPEAFVQLTNLNHLVIIRCPGLTERCQEGPNGTDWPKIQHIPLLSVRDDYYSY